MRDTCPVCNEKWKDIIRVGKNYYWWHWCEEFGIAIAWNEVVQFNITDLVLPHGGEDIGW